MVAETATMAAKYFYIVSRYATMVAKHFSAVSESATMVTKHYTVVASSATMMVKHFAMVVGSAKQVANILLWYPNQTKVAPCQLTKDANIITSAHPSLKGKMFGNVR